MGRKSLVPLRRFLESSTSIYDQSLTLRSMSLIARGLQQLHLGRRGFTGTGLPSGQYVMVAVLEVSELGFKYGRWS